MKHSFAWLVLLLVAAVTAQVRTDNDDATLTFTVDVAQDLTNTLSGRPVSEPGGYVQNNVAPHSRPNDFARGDTGITSGMIYPGGTLMKGKTTIDPKTVHIIGKYHWIGTWTTGLKDFEDAAAHIKGAPAVLAFATEHFDLTARPSSLPEGTLVTEGLWPNAHFTLNRAMVGGTGEFRYFVGDTRVENIGENQTGGCNLRVKFLLRNAKGDRLR